ncbi:hypothetical protein CEXT_364321 [Caerostris extrusa]|uniref:Uncharacterized protein n=1 Tax=Caerostris extrusa TaxID=172846 RepID=A0AAV4U064_CAEEX|nr:hypothetical protein CEXT_364321 [Caerostris extrusa]
MEMNLNDIGIHFGEHGCEIPHCLPELQLSDRMAVLLGQDTQEQAKFIEPLLTGPLAAALIQSPCGTKIRRLYSRP